MHLMKTIYPVYKFDIGDKVRIIKKKKTFEKGYTPNWIMMKGSIVGLNILS